MYRGTTPTLRYILPFDCSQITVLNLCFAQGEQVILEKTLDDCRIEENVISVTLTEADTLLFNKQTDSVQMQLRICRGEDKMASRIMVTTVNRILKDGCLK